MIEPKLVDTETFLKNHCTLPSLPEVVSKVEREINKEDGNINKITELINGEPALTSQILKLVNSAYYGLSSEIRNVRMAIAFMGLNEIYRMVLALSVINTLNVDQKKELNNFWYHSFYSAICTRYLAKKFEPLMPLEDLWSASILHDIGKLVYLKFFPDHYKKLTRYTEKHKCLFSDAEEKYTLPPSSSFGLILCNQWRLPENIKHACEYHTLKDLTPKEGKDVNTSFRNIICLGNLLTMLSGDYLNNETKEKIINGSLMAFGCTENEFLALMGDIYELATEINDFSSVLS